jgi:hypothetical protein
MTRYEGDTITALFERVGYTSLAVPIVVERALLAAAAE